jgi:hypothetical protein
MLVKSVSVKLKKRKLDLITSTNGIKIVLYKGVKKRRLLENSAKRSRSNSVLIRRVELKLMF